MFSTVIHHLEVQKFEPVLEPVKPVLQVQVCGSGKVVKELDRTELTRHHEMVQQICLKLTALYSPGLENV